MVGCVRLKVRGPAGTTVTLRHAEVLDKAGNFYTDNLRGREADRALHPQGRQPTRPTSRTSASTASATSRSTGWPGELDARRPHRGRRPLRHGRSTGSFETSNPLLNQLQHNIVWGQKGNFLDVPTDCPQRDERLGWTGDAQVFARTAAFNMDVAGFFTKWLADVAADQNANGAVPHVVPNVLSPIGRQQPGERVRRRLGGLGRRGRDHPVDDVPRLRRRAAARARSTRA